MASSATSSGSAQRASTADNVAGPPRVPSATASVVIETDTVRESRTGEGHRMVNQYEMITKLGNGQHGEVWYSVNTRTSEVVAIKAMRRKNPKQDRMSLLRKPRMPRSPQHVPVANNMSITELKILKEIAIMKKLRHPHVVQLLEVLNDNLKEKIYMVMEFMDGGEIKWRTDNEEPLLRVSQTRRICRDVLLGLEYLHSQGIIHRDIKPANLLWSADRRVVKIADFGISHFSYAQFLAAKGKAAAAADGQEEHDKILMDESDLSKFAGTPTFLAPEILSDGSDLSSSSTATNLQTVDSLAGETRKQGITKAIDIWAFGVTLYAFLFGKLPFVAESEYLIYAKIKDEDFDVPELMGLDKIPVGGRHQKKPRKGQETEGYLVVDLLQGLLEKNPSRRLTLQDVKRHPWITRDMPHADLWLRTTGPSGESASLAPTEDETSSALSTVLFRYRFRNRFPKSLASGLTTFIRNIRPQRSFRNPSRAEKQAVSEEEQRYRRVGTRSMPHVELSSGGRSSAQDKGKQPVRPQGPRNKSSVDVRSSQQTKSLDWASTQSGGFNIPEVGGSGSKPRRGSAPGHARAQLESLRVPEPPSRVASASSQQRSPASFQTQTQTQTQSPSSPQVNELQQDSERPRSRLSMWMRWVMNKPASWAPSHQPSSSTLVSGAVSPVSATSSAGPLRPAPQRDLSSRRSEDAFNRFQSRGDHGSLTQAMRAASWGEVGGYARPSEDMNSLYSDHGEDGPDEDTYLVGFGGVAQSPVSTVPSAVLSTVSSMGSLAPPVPMSAAQVLLQRRDPAGEPPPSAADPATQDTITLARQAQYRSHATSPLSHPASAEDLDRHAPTFEESSASSDSDSDSGEHTPSEADFGEQPGHTSLMFQEEDEESDSDEEAQPLEVRTRRPSYTFNSRPTSPRRPSIPQEGSARPTIHI